VRMGAWWFERNRLMKLTTPRAAVYFAALFIAMPALAASASAGDTSPGGCYSESVKIGASGRVYSWKAGC
jgi:hypothetical protein